MMLDLFNQREFIVFTTRDFAVHERCSLSAASKKLARLAEKKLLTKVTKGVWANSGHPYFHPLSCVPYLLGKEQGYVSFLTVLHLNDLISQIPATIQIATTGHTRKLKSPVGVFEFIQVKPELMQSGITWSETHIPFLVATSEKALVDILYIATRKHRRFSKLPELDLDNVSFKQAVFQEMLHDLAVGPRIKNAMLKSAANLSITKTQSRRLPHPH